MLIPDHGTSITCTLSCIIRDQHSLLPTCPWQVELDPGQVSAQPYLPPRAAENIDVYLTRYILGKYFLVLGRYRFLQLALQGKSQKL